MGKNEKKGENRCPVCGRFASKKVLDACKGMMSEVERTQRDKIAQLSSELAARNAELKSLKEKADARLGLYKGVQQDYDKLKKEYDALLVISDRQRVELHRLENMSLWDRVFHW